SLRRGETAPPEWASSFDAAAARAAEDRDLDFLEGALAGEAGRTAHPTPDHYLPLLYVVGAAADGERPTWPIVGFDMSSLSMRAALFG
ncbi:4,5-DOPA dioxygenase extradiol, partial [bacterium]|nr:4,5-DOPA dioxygenase extradiol [bacterium]